MAAGSHIQVTSGSGPFISTGPAYTESATSVLDQKVINGLPYYATYSVSTGATLLTTANAHLLQIMAGSSLNVKLMRLQVVQQAAAAGGTGIWQLLRLTSAGSGGTVGNPVAWDPADAAPGATAQTLPSAKGSEGALLLSGTWTVLASPSSTLAQPLILADWDFEGRYTKAPTIAAGTSNGLALKNLSAIPAASVNIIAVLIELPY